MKGNIHYFDRSFLLDCLILKSYKRLVIFLSKIFYWRDKIDYSCSLVLLPLPPLSFFLSQSFSFVWKLNKNGKFITSIDHNFFFYAKWRSYFLPLFVVFSSSSFLFLSFETHFLPFFNLLKIKWRKYSFYRLFIFELCTVKIIFFVEQPWLFFIISTKKNFY